MKLGKLDSNIFLLRCLQHGIQAVKQRANSIILTARVVDPRKVPTVNYHRGTQIPVGRWQTTPRSGWWAWGPMNVLHIKAPGISEQEIALPLIGCHCVFHSISDIIPRDLFSSENT